LAQGTWDRAGVKHPSPGRRSSAARMQPGLQAFSDSGNFGIFCRSLALVGVAELFDKTWFMGFILALKYGARTVFVGSFSALFLHTILAAAFGYAFARLLSRQVLNWMTAVLFFGFALLYAKDWYQADPEADVIEAGKEEAEGEVGSSGENGHASESQQIVAPATLGRDAHEPEENEVDECMDVETSKDPGQLHAKPSSAKAAADPGMIGEWAILGKSFMGVFIAEWGDRTQIAMVGQHSSQPMVPVFLGSTMAFFLLTLSAVGAASLLHGRKLRERVVFGCSSCCFALFGVLTLRDAVMNVS